VWKREKSRTLSTVYLNVPLYKCDYYVIQYGSSVISYKNVIFLIAVMMDNNNFNGLFLQYTAWIVDTYFSIDIIYTNNSTVIIVHRYYKVALLLLLLYFYLLSTPIVTILFIYSHIIMYFYFCKVSHFLQPSIHWKKKKINPTFNVNYIP